MMQSGRAHANDTRTTLPRGAAIIGTIIVAAITFALSSGLAHRGVSHGVSIALGVTMVLNGLVAVMREISAGAQQWTTVLATGASGVTLGLLVRLFV